MDIYTMSHYSCNRSVIFVGVSTQVCRLLLFCLCTNVVAVPTPAPVERKPEEMAYFIKVRNMI